MTYKTMNQLNIVDQSLTLTLLNYLLHVAGHYLKS
jgi:hypothetical protein